MKYIINESQLKMIRKYMKTFINEAEIPDSYIQGDNDPNAPWNQSDEDDEDDEKAKSLTIYYMSRENMLSIKNNPKLDEDDFSVRVDLNFLANYDGEALAISDMDGDIIRNPNDIISSLDISAPQNMEKQKMQITNMLRQKVVSKTIVEYIDSLDTNENVSDNDEITAYVVINDK